MKHKKAVYKFTLADWQEAAEVADTKLLEGDTLKNVVTDLRFRLSGLANKWQDIIQLLQYQLPVVDEEGVPRNIHLLGTLRDAYALMLEMAVVSNTKKMLTHNTVNGQKR